MTRASPLGAARGAATQRGRPRNDVACTRRWAAPPGPSGHCPPLHSVRPTPLTGPPRPDSASPGGWRTSDARALPLPLRRRRVPLPDRPRPPPRHERPAALGPRVTATPDRRPRREDRARPGRAARDARAPCPAVLGARPAGGAPPARGGAGPGPSGLPPLAGRAGPRGAARPPRRSRSCSRDHTSTHRHPRAAVVRPAWAGPAEERPRMRSRQPAPSARASGSRDSCSRPRLQGGVANLVFTGSPQARRVAGDLLSM